MKRLLIVDDEASALLGMGYYFRRAGYEVHCAREREEAEALLLHERYDCAIVDLCITPEHGADGLDLIAFARGTAPETRIVVLTGHASSAAEEEARHLAADVFLKKPRPLEELRGVVDDLTAGAA